MPKSRPFDVAELLDTPEAQADVLSTALAEGDALEIAHALDTIARARGLSGVEQAVRHGDEDTARRDRSGTEIATMIKAMHALGLKLTAVPA